MRNTEIKLKAPNPAVIGSAFERPAEAGRVLSAVLDGLLRQLVAALLPGPQAVLLPDEEIDREWPGCLRKTQEAMKEFVAQAESVTRQLADQARDQLWRARLLEQAKGRVTESPLYQALVVALAGDPLDPAQRDQYLQSLLGGLKKPDESLRKAARANRLWRGARMARARPRLEKALDKGFSGLHRFTEEQCRLILSSTVRAAVEGRLQMMAMSRQWLEAQASPAHLQQRQRDLREDPAWTGQTSLDHPGSTGPGGGVLERVFDRRCRFLGKGGRLDLAAFWHAFGEFYSARDELPAEEGLQFFQAATDAFISSEATSYFGDLTLRELYVQAEEPLPLDLLDKVSYPPLVRVAEVQTLEEHALRLLEAPSQLRAEAAAQLGKRWETIEGEDPNVIVMAQVLDGLTVRAFLENGNPVWSEGVEAETVDTHAATPKLLQAVNESRVLERVKGLRQTTPDRGLVATEPLQQPVAAPVPDGSE